MYKIGINWAFRCVVSYYHIGMQLRIASRKNKSGPPRQYLQIVKSVWNKAKGYPTHQVVGNLGRVDELVDGQFDSLIKSLSAYSKLKLNDITQDLFLDSAMDLGPRTIIEHLWHQVGLDKILTDLGLSETHRECIFRMVLGRIENPVSKRSTQIQEHRYLKVNEDSNHLNEYYRSLDEIIPHHKAIENRLFSHDNPHLKDKQKHLFAVNDMDIVFFDTTSIALDVDESDDMFYRGYSKDNRPEDPQILVGLVVSASGIPIAHYCFPGNTADVSAFQQAFTDIKSRFPIRRIILVADRGCTSQTVMTAIKNLGMEYILGGRLRSDHTIRDKVLSKKGNFTRYDDVLGYKEVVIDSERFVIVKNQDQAYHDKVRREDILLKLTPLEGQSSKNLMGNRGYTRFLKKSGTIELDTDRIARDARYDGKWVLRSNTQDLTATDLIEAYKSLWIVERFNRLLKDDMAVAPVYHRRARRVKAHILICFLAVRLWATFVEALRTHQPNASPHDVWEDVRKLKAANLEFGFQRIIVRKDLEGQAGTAFRAIHCTVPPRVTVLGVTNQDRSAHKPASITG